MQALVKLALEPQWEAKFEPNVYGFRPGRSAQDAIGAIFLHIRVKPKYVLDADIEKCFDQIGHAALLKKLHVSPPIHRLIGNWLKAGMLENGKMLFPEAGTPQGGGHLTTACQHRSAWLRDSHPCRIAASPSGCYSLCG